jgi:hypothetical protein
MAESVGSYKTIAACPLIAGRLTNANHLKILAPLLCGESLVKDSNQQTPETSRAISINMVDRQQAKRKRHNPAQASHKLWRSLLACTAA